MVSRFIFYIRGNTSIRVLHIYLMFFYLSNLPFFELKSKRVETLIWLGMTQSQAYAEQG
jgi:hypothetical protein